MAVSYRVEIQLQLVYNGGYQFMTQSTSAIESMKRITQFTREVTLQEYRDAANELFKFDDDLKIILSEMSDKVKELRAHRMALAQECQAVNSAFDEMDRIFAGPRGQTAAKNMGEFIHNVRTIRELLESKRLRKLLAVFATLPPDQ
jgi:hypothetical protein